MQLCFSFSRDIGIVLGLAVNLVEFYCLAVYIRNGHKIAVVPESIAYCMLMFLSKVGFFTFSFYLHSMINGYGEKPVEP